jgi:hypothetical protein
MRNKQDFIFTILVYTTVLALTALGASIVYWVVAISQGVPK